MNDKQIQNLYHNLISKFHEEAEKLSNRYINKLVLLNASDERIEEFTRTERDWIDVTPDFCQVMAKYNGQPYPSSIFVSASLQQAIFKNKYLVINDEGKLDDDFPF